uniref:ENT domain-containing protein n=1 Tax=Globodera rostochiensis TaxID=31243 RepID=A0A914HSE9_GLORO
MELTQSEQELRWLRTSCCLNATFNLQYCHFLLRALEKQAFENVVFAFRAHGPLTQYTELLLDHLKTALFIDDDEFNTKIRMAANNPYVCRIAQQLNPSYDNDARWFSYGYDLTGIELAKIKKMSANQNSKLVSHVGQNLCELHKHNRSLPHANEALSLLMQLPKQPYVPERLRKFLNGTESNFGERIAIEKEENSQSTAQQQKPRKNSVGRPRKRKQTNDTIPQQTAKEEQKKELQKSELFAKCPTITHHNVKRPPFYDQRPSTSTNVMDNLAELTLSRQFLPQSSKCISLSASNPLPQQQQCHHLSVELQNGANCPPIDEHGVTGTVVSNHDNLSVKHKRFHKDRKDRRESEDTTAVCARLRPFGRDSPSKTIRATDKKLLRPKRNTNSIDCANDLQKTHKYFSYFRPNPKYYGQTPIQITKKPCDFATDLHYGVSKRLKPSEERSSDKPNDVTNESQRGISTERNLITSPLQVATARFVVQSSSQQNLTASNAIVEADHAYEKTFPSVLAENDVTDSISPLIITKSDGPITDRMENGLSNGICKSARLSHLTKTSAFEILSTNQVTTDRSIPKAEVVETSGLDFLASTASLLAPMESAVKCSDKMATTKIGNYIYISYPTVNLNALTLDCCAYIG